MAIRDRREIDLRLKNLIQRTADLELDLRDSKDVPGAHSAAIRLTTVSDWLSAAIKMLDDAQAELDRKLEEQREVEKNRQALETVAALSADFTLDALGSLD